MREAEGHAPDLTGDVAIRELGPSAKVRLQGDGAVRAPALADTRVLQIGPGDWLIIGEAADGEALLSQVREANRNLRPGIGSPPQDGSPLAFAVGVSQAYVTLEITGARARELLEKACGLDLHPKEFAVGAGTRTRFANVAVVVERVGAEVFRCHAARSHRDYLVSWLNDAAGEWRAG